jgi:hypothetical protein
VDWKGDTLQSLWLLVLSWVLEKMSSEPLSNSLKYDVVYSKPLGAGSHMRYRFLCQYDYGWFHVVAAFKLLLFSCNGTSVPLHVDRLGLWLVEVLLCRNFVILLSQFVIFLNITVVYCTVKALLFQLHLPWKCMSGWCRCTLYSDTRFDMSKGL